MGFNKILIMLLMISSVMLTGCTSINLKYFSAGTNSRGMLEGNFDLVEVDETTKIKDEVDETTTGEDSLTKNTNKGTSIDDDEDANNFYNQPTGNITITNHQQQLIIVIQRLTAKIKVRIKVQTWET